MRHSLLSIQPVIRFFAVLLPSNRVMIMDRCGRILRSRARGQTLTLIALILPLLVMLAMTVIELHTRTLEVAEVEDALRQAARSSVQLLDYTAFADNQQQIDEERVRAVARQIFATNLQSVRGLDEPIGTLVDRVQWEIYPSGGTCTFSGEERPPVTLNTPMVCAHVRPIMTGLLGWGTYQPQIHAAETLDRIR